MCRDDRRVALVPASDLDYDRLRSIRHREPMQIETRYTRMGNLQRWYRGLVSRIAEGIDVSPEALHCECKFKAGLIEQIIMVKAATIGAGVAVRLKSTSYSAMDQTSFERYVDVATEILCRDYLGDISSRARQKLILEWVGHRPK